MSHSPADLASSTLIKLISAAQIRGQPLVMGVVNVTPDSFSDGGAYQSVSSAVSHALNLASEGAEILDIGGESTRPGAEAVSVEEELARVIPVIQGIRRHSDLPISVDTSKPEVMVAALEAGASMVNDVNALRAEGAMDVVVRHQVPVVLMHMQGQPRTMQNAPYYDDVVREVCDFLRSRAQACVASGLDPQAIVLDPGFGFGKSLSHNTALLAQLESVVALGFPVLAGLSRKSMLGAITGRTEPRDRRAASIAAAMIASQKGAALIRVHDVSETVDALKVWCAVRDLQQQKQKGES